MSLFQIIALILSLAAAFAYVNERLFRLPNTIGVMLIGLVMSLLMIAISAVYPASDDWLLSAVQGIDFDRTVLEGMLSFLLFAGALHVNINDLAKQKWVVTLLATAGVLLSTVLVALGMWALTLAFELPLSFLECLIFGALISPTDPIAVLGILKKLGAPKELETMICGESLFNDGVGVVIFLVLVGVATGDHSASSPIAGGMLLFVQEAVGGVVFGLALGWLSYLMLKSIDNYHVEVIITLATVAGGYALASALHLSGPIAIVVAGLLAGNQGRRLAMSDVTRRRLDDFWELVDEVLNVVLFVMIGIEVLILTFKGQYFVAGIIAIPMVLLARAMAVGSAVTVLRLRRSFPSGVVTLLTWGGLRGGISVALALSLPAGEAKQVIVAITYMIVIFSISVQGLTVGPMISRRTSSAPQE